MSEGNYKGLPNIGATCYINSFLQTLFMTPEFRDHIYQWTYNEKIHPHRKDSILFQLQKLFAKLELKCQDISTNELVKSFQWQDDEAFLQQDIQEFNRVLFEALQKSLSNTKDPHAGMIKQLYEGQLAHFTKCLECHTESSREQTFQDLILIIKNVYEKIYNPSIELSLQRYIKPQLLDQDNLYDCSVCQKKVRAQRGVKFIKLPKLLNVVLQRFHFDYFTMTRTKMNDKITFPHILNFNSFFNSYEQIPNKLNQDCSEYFIQEQPPKKTIIKPKPSSIGTKKVVSKVGTTSTQPSVAGKVKTKPSANTKSFLQQMRKKKMNQQICQNQDLIFVSGTSTVKEETATTASSQRSTEHKTNGNMLNGVSQQRSVCIENQVSLVNHSQHLQNNLKIEQNTSQVDKKELLDIPPPPPPEFLIGLQPPKLSEPYNAASIVKSEKQSLHLQKQLQIVLQQKQNSLNQRQKNLDELLEKNRQLIEQYLKDGPLVYELYSILVHSGTSNAGHYISYIKSFENDKWYLFNDERVTECNVNELDKTFGGAGGSNAYVLYYRLVDENKFKLETKIPEYLEKIIKEEEQSYKMRQISKLVDLENTLILKIYFQLGVKTIEIRKSSTLSLLFEKSKDTFNIKTYKEGNQPEKIIDQSTYIREDNIRIRLFNPVNDTKLDTYRGKEEQTLEGLEIRSYQNFILQLKADTEEFDDYVAGFMSIRIALWEDNLNLTSLQEKCINLHKVSINKSSLMKEIEEVIRSKRAQFLGAKEKKDDCICIVKRHQNDEYLYHQIINLPDYYDKSIDSIGIFEGQILFIEPDAENLNWPRQFQNEINRISIKIINSNSQDHQTLTTDSRISLNQLKLKICNLINQPVDETIVRRGNKSGLELKNGNASLKENRFINGTTLFLEQGIPAKMGEIRIQLFLAEDAVPTLFNRLHEFQFIADVPIDTNLKASEVKSIFKDLLKKLKNVDIDIDKMRIREKVNDKMGKIYREKPMKEQQLIEKRQIAIEIKEDKLDMKDFSIYVRVWNQQNWTLSQKYEFIVNKNTTMKELSQQIYQFLHEHNELTIILPEEMDICRILSIHKFNIIDLVDMEYFGMVSDVSVLGQPMFVNSDGLLYIVKQTGIEPRQLTKQQETVFGGKIKTVTRPTKGRVPASSSNPQKKEKGITIKVIEREEEKAPQKKQEDKSS